MHTYIPAYFFYITYVHPYIHAYIDTWSSPKKWVYCLSWVDPHSAAPNKTDLFLKNTQPGIGPDLKQNLKKNSFYTDPNIGLNSQEDDK